MATTSKTQAAPYGEFFFLMLSHLADGNCRHCHGRGYVGVIVKTTQPNGVGWEWYCRCAGKTLARFKQHKSNKEVVK